MTTRVELMRQVAELDRELVDARVSSADESLRILDRCRQIEAAAGPDDEALIQLAIHCLMRKHGLLPGTGAPRRRSHGRLARGAVWANTLPPGVV